jgi:hypothetical protein
VRCKFCLPLRPIGTVNTVSHSYGASAVLLQFLRAEIRQQPDLRYEVSKFFFASSCAKFNVQIYGWTERFTQLRGQYLILD